MPTKKQREHERGLARDLLSDLRYELDDDLHTYGACKRGCGRPARGCGVCFRCRIMECAAELYKGGA
jgi:hypothetical protein